MDHDKLREAIKYFRSVGRETRYQEMAELVLGAAESTLPKTKMVEVWHVEYARLQKEGDWFPFVGGGFQSPGAADASVLILQRDPKHSCIRVTGPHQQEVPA